MEGYEKDNDYVEFKMFVPDTVPEKYSKIAAMIQKRYNLHIKKLTRKDVWQHGYGRKIFQLINSTFKDLYGYSELSGRQIDEYVKMYLNFADLNLITLVEDRNCDNKLVGVGISIPSERQESSPAASLKLEIPLPERLLSSALPLTVSDSATVKRQPWPKPCYWETGEDCPRKPFSNSGKAGPRTYWPFQDCIWVWCTGSYHYVSRFWATVKRHVSCVLQPLCYSVCSIV